jgi:hypothetical protein
VPVRHHFFVCGQPLSCCVVVAVVLFAVAAVAQLSVLRFTTSNICCSTSKPCRTFLPTSVSD